MVMQLNLADLLGHCRLLCNLPRPLSSQWIYSTTAGSSLTLPMVHDDHMGHWQAQPRHSFILFTRWFRSAPCMRKGHVGNPFNELVDGLCTYYAALHSDGRGPSEPHPGMAFAMYPQLGKWAFVLVLPPDQMSQYPVEVLDGVLYLSTIVCPLSDLEVPSDVIGAAIDLFQAGDIAAANDGTSAFTPGLSPSQSVHVANPNQT